MAQHRAHESASASPPPPLAREAGLFGHKYSDEDEDDDDSERERVASFPPTPREDEEDRDTKSTAPGCSSPELCTTMSLWPGPIQKGRLMMRAPLGEA